MLTDNVVVGGKEMELTKNLQFHYNYLNIGAMVCKWMLGYIIKQDYYIDPIIHTSLQTIVN